MKRFRWNVTDSYYVLIRLTIACLLLIVNSVNIQASVYNYTLTVGETKTFKLGNGGVWNGKLSDPTIINLTVGPTADQGAVVTALKPGIATCDLNYMDNNKGYWNTYIIKVIDVQSITIPQTLTLTVGEEYKFNPIIQDQEMEKYLLKWDCIDSKIATIDSDYSYKEPIPNSLPTLYNTIYVRGGKIKAVNPGTTQIICTYKNISATCQLTVEPIYVSEINFEHQNYELEEFQSIKVNPVIIPENATIKDLTWKSSDPSVAFVDSKGNVTAVSKGKTVISTISKDGSQISGSYVLTVTSENKSNELEFGIKDFVRFTTTIDQETPFTLNLQSPSEKWKIDSFTVNDIDASDEIENGVYSVSQIESPTTIEVAYRYDGTIEFYDLSSGVEDLVLNNTEIKLYKNEGQLSLSNLQKGSIINIYTLGGILIGSHTAINNIIMIDLEPNYYIVSIDDIFFKIKI